MRGLGLLAAATVFSLAGIAEAGPIAVENAKAGYGYDWYPSDWRIGNAQRDGVVDVYPATWSLRAGDTLRLKVRSTTSYRVRVFRLGWYGGDGSRKVADIDGLPADPQPYSSADPRYGMVQARWHDSVSIATGSFPPGVYVARAEQTSGKRAMTFFVVRDDASAVKMPILVVVGTATHQAYNAWPGAKRGGMSLYDFNSSSMVPSESDGIHEAVKVSSDRPFLDGDGTADLPNYEVPAIRFLEKRGWDVAYATDEDLHENPQVMDGRAAIVFVGHSEYWSRGRFDAVLSARDRGVNLMFATGDTLSWQIRYEDGTQTVVGYKSSYTNDPEHILGRRAKYAGDIEEAKRHYRLVTKAWRSLEYDTSYGIDERRPGIILTGVQSAAQIHHDYPWAHWSIKTPSHWLFEGTGVVYGSKVRNIMGYEVDSAKTTDSFYDKWRPAGQVQLGAIIDAETGSAKGSNAYYRAASGAEIVSFGATNFTWALDDYASGTTTADARVQRMVDNALRRWTGMSPATMSNAGVVPPNEDGEQVHGARFSHPLGAQDDDARDPDATPNEAATGCSTGRGRAGFGAFAVLGIAVIATRRRRAS
jgi:hypothetical protein